MRNLGRYEIDARIGEGAMAEVYRARDPEIGRVVAIKILKASFSCDPDLGERFLREARAAGALSHANIATIYDFGMADGTPYIAMELVDGQPLDVALNVQGRLPYERVLEIGQQLASALAYAHRHGVVHRDVKPSNILLSTDGRTVKLLDFGVARISEAENENRLGRTQAGQLVGTPRYMSPEQALGLPVDERSDLLSLGVVLYELITGKVAFPGTALASLAIQIAQERVEPIDRTVGDCPPGLRFVIDKLLAKKADQRFANGEALLAALSREVSAQQELSGSRRGLSLRAKLPLGLALLTGISLLLCVTFTLNRERQTLERMAISTGSSTASFVTNNASVLMAENAGLPFPDQDWSALQAFAVTAVRDPEIRDIVIVDADNVVRAAGDPSRVGAPYSAPADEKLMAGFGNAAVTSTPDSGSGAGIRFVHSIRYAGVNFGKVDLVVRRTALDAAIVSAQNSLATLIAIIMLVVVVVGYLSGALVTRPLSRLRKALEDAPKAGFAMRISHQRGDEIGAVFDAFNNAAAAVEPLVASRLNEASSAALLETRIDPRIAA